ncbi:MAG: DUF4259 domain-containing protein [Rhodanobacteraceae bacterium]|nr:DUF4259 domain-containing protein [Rhodanobacteraceae bacterium]
MGAWGTDPFENDAAADFVALLRRTRKANRLGLIRNAFEECDRVCLLIKQGNITSSLSESDIDELKSSRLLNLEWYRQNGQEFPFHVLPEYASEEAWIKHASSPVAVDGSDEALRAIAAAQILAENICERTANGRAVALPELTTEQRAELSGIAINTLECVLTNDALAEAWGQEWGEVSSGISQMVNALTPNYAFKPTAEQALGTDCGALRRGGLTRS